ncbi:iron-containing redox enzyme family protein, partial [Pseudomonas sp. MH10]
TFESVELNGVKENYARFEYKNKFVSSIQAKIESGSLAFLETEDGELLGLLAVELTQAFKYGNDESLTALHFVANELLNRRYLLVGDAVELSPLMFKVQQLIMGAQIDSDLAQVSEENLPVTAEQFRKWFSARSTKYEVSTHPLFDYIRDHATMDQFHYFIETEAGVHASFDDVIALNQVGVRGAAKLEFFENFKDELGGSDPDRFHLAMFGRLISELEIGTVKKSSLAWQAMACGNYMLYLAHFRSLYHYCAGYLCFLEALTPNRFASIAMGRKRLGLSGDGLAYHYEHSELDAKHADGWLENIILSEINQKGAGVAKLFAKGVLLREFASTRYWDSVLLKFRPNH